MKTKSGLRKLNRQHVSTGCLFCFWAISRGLFCHAKTQRTQRVEGQTFAFSASLRDKKLPVQAVYFRPKISPAGQSKFISNTLIFNMKRPILLATLACLALANLTAQSTEYVIKGGLSLATQKWDNQQRRILFTPHVAVAAETFDEDNDRSSLFFQAGYFQRGSTNINYYNTTSGGSGSFGQDFRFNNISILFGAKQKFGSEKARYFYFGGLRGEYTLSTNIDELTIPHFDDKAYEIYYAASNPSMGGLRRFLFGVSAGGGVEFKLGELVGGQIELAVNPDLTDQYYSPAFTTSIADPFSGNPLTLPERSIKNISLELTVGLRLLHKVVLED